jgi:hypothetical protein
MQDWSAYPSDITLYRQQVEQEEEQMRPRQEVLFCQLDYIPEQADILQNIHYVWRQSPSLHLYPSSDGSSASLPLLAHLRHVAIPDPGTCRTILIDTLYQPPYTRANWR